MTTPPGRKNASLPWLACCGAVLMLMAGMDAQAQITRVQKISNSPDSYFSRLAGPLVLPQKAYFGTSAAVLGDLDQNGAPDLAVVSDSALYVLFLKTDQTLLRARLIDIGVESRFRSVARIGDLDHDGISELAVGMPDFERDPCCLFRGAVFIVFLDTDGTVRRVQRISSTTGGFTGPLDPSDWFGSSVAGLGDLDGDGVADLAVGAPGDDDGSINQGAVWILFLNPDGSVKAQQKISEAAGNFSGVLSREAFFGAALTGLGDLDGSDIPHLAVGATSDGYTPENLFGDARGAVYVLFLNRDGTVRAYRRIDDAEVAFDEPLPKDSLALFGGALVSLGDLDGDGTLEVGVSATAEAAERSWVMSLATDGTLQRALPLDNRGYVIASVDYDHDGTQDLTFGDPNFSVGGMSYGAVQGVLLNPDGTIRERLPEITGVSPLEDDDQLGTPLANLGDLDGDGLPELAVGAPGDDDGGWFFGAAWVLFLNADGSVKQHHKLSPLQDSLLSVNSIPLHFLGAGLGDFDGDAVPDLMAGNRILLLNRDGSVGEILPVDIDLHRIVDFSVSPLDDLDGDGYPELAVGYVETENCDMFGACTGRVGRAEVLFLHADGTVATRKDITHVPAGPGVELDTFYSFGKAVAAIGDVNGDGIPDLAIGAPGAGRGNCGAVYIMLLNADGSLQRYHRIDHPEEPTEYACGSDLPERAEYQLGRAVTGLGDLDDDGTPDLAVSAVDVGFFDGLGIPVYDSGIVYLLFLHSDGTLMRYERLDRSLPELASLAEGDQFGLSLVRLGDLDGDGSIELAVGAPGDDDGGEDQGAVWILSLSGRAGVGTEPLETPSRLDPVTFYPNPFSRQAQLTITVPTQQRVVVEVFDTLGRRVAQLHDGILTPETQHAFVVEAAGWPSGLYMVRVRGTTLSATRTVLLVR